MVGRVSGGYPIGTSPAVVGERKSDSGLFLGGAILVGERLLWIDPAFFHRFRFVLCFYFIRSRSGRTGRALSIDPVGEIDSINIYINNLLDTDKNYT